MSEHAREITNKSELDAIMTDGGPTVMIDFWASWCGPCKMMAPHYEAVAEQFADEPIEFYKVNTEEHPELAAPFNVRSLPTIVVVHDGKILDALIGAQDARTLVKKGEWAMSKARGEGFFDRLLGRKKDGE